LLRVPVGWQIALTRVVDPSARM